MNDGRRDLESAVTELAERLPAPLVPLARLAFNYRWSWLPDGPAIFADADQWLWNLCAAGRLNAGAIVVNAVITAAQLWWA